MEYYYKQPLYSHTDSYCTIGLIPMHLVILNISKLSTEEYPIGSVLYLTCESGYTLYGTDMITCMENDTWSELLPQCISKRLWYVHVFCI